MHRPFALITLAASLGLSLLPRPAAAQPAAAPGPAPDRALITRIDAIAQRALAAPAAAGLSIAVARGDTILLDRGYGSADLEHGTPATDATLFRIGSVTKQYTAAAIMKLAEQGKLHLDDDFTTYIDYPTGGRVVTIRHLLTHTSGIKNYTDLPGFFDTAALDQPPEKVLDSVRNLPFDFEPGSKWAYSNTGYHLLGMVIEKVSGIHYAQYLQDEFLTPLHLTRTRYDVASDIIPGRARGYTVTGGRPANAPHLSMTVPFSAGGLMASAGDLVRWQIALAAGRAVSLDSYKQMTTPATLNDGSTTGYGFGLKIDGIDGHPNLGHGGGIHGFNSMLVYFPAEGLSVAVISSSPAVPAGLVAADIAREALNIKTPDLQDLSLPAAELEPLTGTYRINEIGMDLTVTTAAGKVMVQGTGQPAVPVMAQGGREFRASWDKSVRIVFDPPAAPGEHCPSLTLHQGGGTFKALRVP